LECVGTETGLGEYNEVREELTLKSRGVLNCTVMAKTILVAMTSRTAYGQNAAAEIAWLNLAIFAY
jgi:hypothetical protein